MATTYPGGQYRPLSSTQGEPALNTKDIICFHTMVGYLQGTESMFKQDGYGGTESHFGVGGSWDGSSLDGVVWQWQDLNYQADANLEGNWHVISIETSDGGDSTRPWTDKQLTALIGLTDWLCNKYNIPTTLIPDTKAGRRGIGYHRQGCDPTRVSGGEKWSDAYGKTCPGDARIKQLKEIIIPALGGEIPPTTVPPPSTSSTSTYRLEYLDGESMSLRYLKEGTSGVDVKTLQHLLGFHGCSTSVDGQFGPNTESAVSNFQKKKNLSQDGTVGPLTMERLLEG